MEKFNLKEIKIVDRHLYKKRDITEPEVEHILWNIFGIEISTREDFVCDEDYEDYKIELVEMMNDWLDGYTDDSSIASFACDCSDEQLGIINMIPLIKYLQDIEVI